MATLKKEGVIRSASGRYLTTDAAPARRGAAAVETLREVRTAKVASALKQANSKTGLFSVKK